MQFHLLSALAALLFFGIQPAAAQNEPRYNWVTTAGTATTEYGVDIAAGPDGSVFVAGHFEDTTDMGGRLESRGGRDVFVAKLDAFGNWLWSTSAGSTGRDSLYGIAATADGEVRVVGRFPGDAQFGDETVSMPDSGFAVAAIDGDGEHRWVATGSGVSGFRIDAGGSGSTFIGGGFTESVSIGGHIVSSGVDSNFIAVIDTDGQWQRADAVRHAVLDLAADEAGILTAVSEDSVYRYSETGALQWSTVSPAGALRRIASSGHGTAVIAGIGFPVEDVEHDDEKSLLVAQLDESGSLSWLTNARYGDPTISDLATDARGHVYVMGQFRGGIVFGDGQKRLPGKDYNSTPPGHIGPVIIRVPTRYIAAFSAAGEWLWADGELKDRQHWEIGPLPLETDVTGDTTFASTNAVAANESGVYLTGHFEDSLQLDGEIYEVQGERDTFAASLKNYELTTPLQTFGGHYPAYDALPDTAMVRAP